MSPSQIEQLAMLKRWRPFMRVFGGLSPSGEFEAWAASTKSRANRLMRQGWQVWEASR